MVMLDEAAYEALLRKADLWEPALPEADAAGNYPALAALAVIQARDVSARPPQGRSVASRVGPPGRHSTGNAQPYRAGAEQAERADHRQD